MRRIVAVAGVVSLLVLGACSSDDDGADVRSVGDDPSASGSASSASGSGSGSTPAEGCADVGTDLAADADTEVEIALVDYGFDPGIVEVEAGVVTFDATNEGEEAHELAVLPGGGDVPFTEGGAPDEDALEAAGAFELEAFAPGETCHATWELDAGSYTLFCIVTSEDGVTHYEKGMRGTLEVS